jgi:hypothetical protein
MVLALGAMVAGTTLGTSGCSGVDTLEDIQSALDLPQGGYLFSDDMPFFGRDDLDLIPLEPVVLPAIPRMSVDDLATEDDEHGHLSGLWLDYIPGNGVMIGKWSDDFGNVTGHLKGIYGKSAASGTWVFFGKVVDLQGRVRGVLQGRFGQGFFRGEWHDAKDGRIGTVEGIADENEIFQGRWNASAEKVFPEGIVVASR